MRTSIAARANLELIDQNYQRWQEDPASVDPSWVAFFEGFELGNLPQRNGAAAAAQKAVADGDSLILGPLTAMETASVAPVVRSASIPVLAFTNDSSQSQPGVWPLGISPDQQIRRLIAAGQAQGQAQASPP